jgi:apolipoprotein N-acyltransferase
VVVVGGDVVVGVMNAVKRENEVVATKFQKKAASTALTLGGVMIALQILDGVLTSIGMSRFGTEMEGNLLLRHLMELIGHIPALVIVKSVAIATVFGLVVAARQFGWVKNALGALSFVYLVAAIIPWTYILFIQPVA